MEKAYIISEIQRTAEENGGEPLGRRRFSRLTGIQTGDWLGKFWARWGDALEEAGYSPNEFQQAYEEDFLLRKYAQYTLELGHLPTSSELRLKARKEDDFPSHTTFDRLGSKEDIAAMVADYCEGQPDLDQVQILCNEYTLPRSHASVKEGQSEPGDFGSVYLLKAGRYYKIGRTNAMGRREHEIRLQLPQRAELVHEIRTDDPVGIEAYWHARFAEKRGNGEWFDLDSADVKAFKRRNFM